VKEIKEGDTNTHTNLKHVIPRRPITKPCPNPNIHHQTPSPLSSPLFPPPLMPLSSHWALTATLTMSHPHSPDHCASAVNSLYCGEDASEVVQQDADTWISSYHQSPSPSTIPSPPSDENTITKFIDSESQFMPLSDYLHRCRHRSIDTTARQDSINWILKVPIRIS
jgi:cyclin D1/2/4